MSRRRSAPVGRLSALIEKLRFGWREALSRQNQIIGLSEDEYFGRK
ncbi:hypothetical protein Salmuc_00397 [Salipiger mucosus DSM 16094]|uniref:Uncharacterized protein n=1 Tax=Salipiger mucosus DSM 16094 TaxID=1123237 RepID=S9REL1_9RHOB|nr:hypothetical protein Salmuc_00397 [Salipiger mucosus DSM 16094]